MGGKLTWRYNGLIMSADDGYTPDFYLKEAAKQLWNVCQLERNINVYYFLYLARR